MAQQFELRMPYGPGFTLVGEIRDLDAQAMTIETSWEVKRGLRLHLADHFPRPDKPYLPGVMALQVLAESSGLKAFRVAEISGVAFGGRRPIEPGEIVLETKAPVWEMPEEEFEGVAPAVCQVSGSVNAPKMTCQLMKLEAVSEPTVFLSPAMAIRSLGLFYDGLGILVPCGSNLPNTVLAEHMCQSVVAMNAYAEAFQGKKFLLTGISEAKFFSDVPWDSTVVSQGRIEINDQDPRFGTASVETFLDDAPVAMIEMSFAAIADRNARTDRSLSLAQA